MRYWFINWLLSALSLLIAARLVPGIYLRGFGSALIAAVLIGFFNATVGFVLKILTFPLSLVTFGLFLLVVNALMFRLAAAFVSGFAVRSLGAAFLGALVMSIVGVVLRYIAF